MITLSKKTFFIILAVVLGILCLGTTPASQKIENTSFPTPEKGKWCLGYDYVNQKYRYHTEPKYKEQRRYRQQSSHSFELYENGNFTKEQAKDIEEYLNSRPACDCDIDDIIDNIEYYY